MKAVKVRNIEIGTGIPKICVPIVGVTKQEIMTTAKELADLPVDIAEWRMDWYEEVDNHEEVKMILKELRSVLGDMPILATFRTAREGGERDIDTAEYVSLNKAAADSGEADLIDMELFTGDAEIKEVLIYAQSRNVKVVISNHDFDMTPPEKELIRRLCRMDALGADILKIAVMPVCKKDVLTLLSATLEVTERRTEKPVITMAMTGIGVISRLCGELSGSAVTFGAASRASAPGQIKVQDLAEVLQLIHRSL